ncbi:MAG: hypothetical protein KDA60_06450 [Planctomycetales bacterium]|nr:hypothetical protein [Planctomycetales bacterium]
MPVSGLVVSLCDEAGPRAETLDEIGREPRITVGTLTGQRLAVVLDTESADDDRRLWDWLHALPGVAFVDVAFVGFGLDENASTPRSTSRQIQTAARQIEVDGEQGSHDGK